MKDLAQHIPHTLGLELWLFSLLAIGLLTLLLKQAHRWARHTTTHWDEALLNAASKPLRLLVWLVSLGWMARVLNSHWPEPDLLANALQWRDIGIILCVARFLWHFASEVTETRIERGTQNGGDFDVTTTIVLENPARMSHRRQKETVGLRYTDFAQVEAVVADIRAMLLAHEGIDTSQTLIVNFNGFGASSRDIMVYGFTKTTVWVEFHAIKQDVLLRIGRIVAAHGADIALPTQTHCMWRETRVPWGRIPTHHPLVTR